MIMFPAPTLTDSLNFKTKLEPTFTCVLVALGVVKVRVGTILSVIAIAFASGDLK